MAIWQFDLLLIPNAALSGTDGARLLTQYLIGEVVVWESHKLPQDYADRLGEFLSRGATWDPEWHIFGHEDKTRVDVIVSGEAIQEVKMRIDVRTIDPAMLEHLAAFTRYCQCVLLSLDGHIIAPDAMAIWIELELSPARRFVNDPEKFLHELTLRTLRQRYEDSQ